MLKLSKILIYLILLNGVFLNFSLLAVDCSINYDQDTTISADCDGFELIVNQDFDITIDSGVTLSDDTDGVVIDLAIFNMTGTLINNGSVSTIQTDAITFVSGSVNSIINNGTLAADSNTLNIDGGGNLIRFENTGIMSASTISAVNVGLRSELTTFINSGTISALGQTIFLDSGTITTLNNSGTISSSGDTIDNFSGTLTTLLNSNTISSNGGVAVSNNNGATMGLINNSGTILSETAEGISNWDSTITTLTNSGTIQSDNADAIYNRGGIINTLTNTGTISATNILYRDINNTTGSIGTLINSQGGNDALTYSGVLPNAYYIVINSKSDYGKVEFSETLSRMTFDIHTSSTLIANTTYADVVDGLQIDDITATSGTYNSSTGDTYEWSLNNTSDNLWSLLIGDCEGNCGEVSYPSTAATQVSVNNVANSMNAQFSSFAMTTNFANLNTYDCGLFDKNNGCFSVGGRYTDVNGNNNSDSDSTAVVMVGGYKVDDTFRVAGFVDQMVNNSTPTGIKVENHNPMVGVSFVLNENADHLGYQFKFANAYQTKDVTITRTATGDAEAGSGSTDVTVNSIIAEASYQFLSQNRTSYRPYFAGRYAKIKQDGYTETNVDNGLTYQDLEDESITLIMGLKAKHLMTEQFILKGTVGVEQDIYNDSDNLVATATNIAGITAVDVNSDDNKTRPVVSAGADYFFTPTQRLSFQAQYQELAYTSTSAKTAYVSYTIGF